MRHPGRLFRRGDDEGAGITASLIVYSRGRSFGIVGKSARQFAVCRQMIIACKIGLGMTGHAMHDIS